MISARILFLSKNSAQNSHLVELLYCFCLQLIIELQVQPFHQFVPVDPVGLVQEDLQKISGEFQALGRAKKNALGRSKEKVGGEIVYTDWRFSDLSGHYSQWRL